MNGNRIRVCPDHPRYWQYKGKPVLLLGGTALDNLFRIPELKAHLDLLQSVGGNYARCTMSTHDSGLYPFGKRGNLYDLDSPNEDYWQRFDKALRLASERDIIVQIEVWAEWDTFGDKWDRSPWNPDNNVNYTAANTTLKSSYSGTPSLKIKHDFFYTVPNLAHDAVVLEYQSTFVDQLLSISLRYDNVLYCMTNEMYEGFSPEWGWHWSGYIRDKAAAADTEVETAEMFWESDLTAPKHLASLDHPEVYSFFEASQNTCGRFKGQQHWDNLQFVYERLATKPRPINNVKIYGSDALPGQRERSDRFATECFWRNVIGGCASSRFHRPPWGLGLGEKAQAHIRSMRMLTGSMDIFTCEPHNDLLSNRKPNAAYVTANPSAEHAVYFPHGEPVDIDLRAARGALTAKVARHCPEPVDQGRNAEGRWHGAPVTARKRPPGRADWPLTLRISSERIPMDPRSHNRGATTILFLVCVACCLAESVQASDWPQWRHDAGRTGASQEALAGELHLAWARQLPTPKPAYPKYPRLCFDGSYEPVVLGKTMFVPSMVTDSLTALDTETGEEKWEFFTDGPVRFAPVAMEGRVAFVSDDGHLYCVDAEQGALVWKVRGLPPDRRDRKVVGNDRLISLWPARGGPVLHRGRIYFAAGIWPFEGVSIHAVDAKTGKTVWANHDTGFIKRGLLDHNFRQESGLSPQGYLAVIGGKLFVPSGRAKPGVLDVDTGTLQRYSSGWGGRENYHKGCWYVVGNDKYFFQGGDSYLAARGRRLNIDPANAKELGTFRDPILAGLTVYFSQPINRAHGYRPVGVGFDRIVAWNVANPPKLKQWKDPSGRQWKTGEFPELWSMPANGLRIHLKAGSRLYGGTVDRVAAVDLPTKDATPKVSWTAPLQGTPARMLAADGKLFVITAQGRIHAFGPDEVAVPRDYPPQTDRPLVPDDRWTNIAAKALREADSKGGYCLMLGMKSEGLLRELLRQSQLHVIVIESDHAKVAELRRRLDRDGLYGERVAVHSGDPLSYPLPPYFASLIIVNQPAVSHGKSRAEPVNSRWVKIVFRSLRPCGGVALFLPPPNGKDTLKASEFARALAGADVSRSGRVVVLKRTGPPPGSGEWTHEDGDAGRSLVAQDQRVKSPLNVLWFGGAVDLLYPDWDFTHSRSPTPLVAGGRMFFQVFPDLHAIDIYTGRHLWTRRLPGVKVASQRRNAPCAMAQDRLYVLSSDVIACIDPATGATVSGIDAPSGTSGGWRSLAVVAGRLIGTTKKRLVTVDRLGGEVQWQYEAERTLLAVAVGGGKVFCADVSVPDRRGKVTKTEGRIVALDVATGKLLWQADWKGDGPMKSAPLLVTCEQGDVLIAVHGSVSAYDRRDGSLLWSGKVFKRSSDAPPRIESKHPMLYPDLLVSQAGTAYNPRTGEQLPERLWDCREQGRSGKRGCTRNMAGQHLFSIRHAHVSSVDLTTKEHIFFRGIRTGCTNGLIQAGGLMNGPNYAHGCSCNYSIFTSFALVHLPEIDE